MQNGIPFWYFHDHGGALAGRTVETVDPGGVVKDAIPKERIIGCVVYPATELVAPGKVRAHRGRPLPHRASSTAGRASACTRSRRRSRRPGLKCPLLDNVRAEMWLKLWGNLTFNPISALTHATLAGHLRGPARPRARRADDARGAGGRREARHHLPRAAGEAHRGRRKVGKHKTSMLQDVEAGPPDRDRRARGLRGRAGRPGRACPCPRSRRSSRRRSSSTARWNASRSRCARFRCRRPDRRVPDSRRRADSR